MKKQSLYHAFRLSVALASALLVFQSTPPAHTAITGIADTLLHAPPAGGSLGYNSSPLPSTQGISYVDPVFGTTVRRLTTDHVNDDIYATNMKWNADETRFLHRTTNGTSWPDYWQIIDTASGKITHTGIPNGISAPDGGFDPADPNILYYYGSNGIHKVTLNANGTWSDSVYFTPPANAALKPLGGTLNWFDSSGRYMLVRYGPEPSVHLYDRKNMAAGPYGNPINGTSYIDAGSYIGITPDGQFIVGYQTGAVTGFGMGQGVSWKIDHTNRTVASAPNSFWSLCGDHGSFISSSDGRNYMITNDCYGYAGLWRVDITNNAKGLSEAKQHALPNNKLLLAYKTWNDFGHYSTAARGPLRDWAFLSTEDGGDTFDSGTADYNGNILQWHAYRQAIVGINVITGEIRQLAHHRSRSVNNDYYYKPRVSASWAAKYVGFSSNFNQNWVKDIYAVQFSTMRLENVIWTSLFNTKVTGNSLQKTSGCDGCEDAGSLSQQQIASGNGYVEFTASETSNLRFLGLSNRNSGTTAAAIKFAVRLQAGYAEVRESGVYKINTRFVTGDVFRIAVESGAVKYYKNGMRFYTSKVAPSYPMVVDTALLNLNATITNVKILY